MMIIMMALSRRMVTLITGLIQALLILNGVCIQYSSADELPVCYSGSMDGCRCVEPQILNTTIGPTISETRIPSELLCIDTQLTSIPDYLPGAVLANFTGNTFTKMTEIPPNLAEVQKLYLNGNKIKQFDDLAFKNLKVLKSLFLTHNNIRGIDLTKQTFIGLDNLSFLDLSNNPKILTIPTEVFSGQVLPSLTEIKLANCGLLQIEPDAFKDASILQYIGLSHNSLSEIPTFSSSPLVHLQHLDLSYNRINKLYNLHNMPVIHSLLLGHNQLSHVANGALSHVTSHLSQLELNYNEISVIEPTAFLNLLNLTELNLDHNLLRQMTWEELPWNDDLHQGQLSRISLTGNRWRCGCVNEFLLEGHSAVTLYNSGDRKLTCFTPDKLKGKDMQTVPKSYFRCDKPNKSHHKRTVITCLFVISVLLLCVVGLVVTRKMMRWKNVKRNQNNLYTKFYNKEQSNGSLDQF